jgi:hypothetical protein
MLIEVVQVGTKSLAAVGMAGRTPISRARTACLVKAVDIARLQEWRGAPSEPPVRAAG